MQEKTSYSLGEIAQRFNITHTGEAALPISGIASLSHARQGEISFLENPAYRKQLAHTHASAIILKPEMAEATSLPVLLTPNPYLLYAKVAQLFNRRPLPAVGIHPAAVIGEHCQIAATARIGAYCVIGDHCVIGEHSCLWPQVTLYDGTQLGDEVMIHSGAVIGSDGFGNAHDGRQWVKVPQLGRVVIGNRVEIGANTTIDRGALDDTVIEEGVRLDNQIQIAHNVRIGAHTAIAACVGIAGSTTIGKHCLIGGGVGISGHLTIGDRVVITAMTGVSKSLLEPGMYSSASIAQKNSLWRKMTVRLRHLDELFTRVKRLEERE